MKYFQLLFMLFLFSCTGKSDQNGKAVVKPSGKVVELTLKGLGETMTDMRFEPESIKVKEGDLVKLTLVNESEAKAMWHNFVLVNFGKSSDVAMKAIKASHNDYIPEDSNIIAYTKMAKPGETVFVEFLSPPKGNYQFICSYPGHAMSMRGLFVVE